MRQHRANLPLILRYKCINAPSASRSTYAETVAAKVTTLLPNSAHTVGPQNMSHALMCLLPGRKGQQGEAVITTRQSVCPVLKYPHVITSTTT